MRPVVHTPRWIISEHWERIELLSSEPRPERAVRSNRGRDRRFLASESAYADCATADPADDGVVGGDQPVSVSAVGEDANRHDAAPSI
jgi:hypothetical protein